MLFCSSPTEPASAEPNSKYSSTIVANQDRLISASKEVRILAQRISGFSMIEFNPVASSMKVSWQNPANEVTAAVQQIAKRNSVSIRLLNAKYNELELKASVDRAVTLPNVTSATFNDATGISVSIEPGKLTSRSRERTQSVGGVAVVNIEEGGYPNAVADRRNDEAPWTGGLGYNYSREGEAGCSAAFGARDADGNEYLVSAAHCFGGNNEYATALDGRRIGITSRFDPVMDSVLIRVAGGLSGHVYNAGKSEGYRALVTELSEFTEKGQYVCNSGARSGLRCDIQVANHYYRYALSTNPDVFIIGYLATQLGGDTHAVAQGDSGGPVIQYTSSGNVRAAGITSAGDREVECPSDTVATRCFRDIIYVGPFDITYGGLDIVLS